MKSKHHFFIFAFLVSSLQQETVSTPISKKEKLDTKVLVDRPGVTPQLFNKLVSLLDKDKGTHLEAIKSVEKMILENTAHPQTEHYFNHTPIDFNPNADIFPEISNSDNPKLLEMKSMFNSLNLAWLFLSKLPPKKNKNTTTLLEFGIPFFVPGCRFKEFYYWDSYWILRGLLGMKMEISAVHLIKNFISLIQTYGFVPNGARMYYLGRTQPPIFAFMIYSLYKYNPEKYKTFVLGAALNAAIEEYEWLVKNKSVTFQKNGKPVTMCRYHEESALPRLESFREDHQIAAELEKIKGHLSKQETTKLFSHIRSASESGWDFSSRWLKQDQNLSTIHTSDFIPADLNAIMFKNERIISELLKARGDIKKSLYFEERSKIRAENMQLVLWNSEQKIWNDYDFVNMRMNSERFYFSNIMPLLMGLSPPTGNINEIFHKYRKELFGYVGGIPCSGESVFVSTQQWDFPNVWAPHESMIVDYLLDANMYETALHVARSFYENIRAGYKKYSVFFEKYDCLVLGETGKGGEYSPQEGFGWTNGVAIDFIVKFGKNFLNEFDHEKSFQKVVKSLEIRKEIEENTIPIKVIDNEMVD